MRNHVLLIGGVVLLYLIPSLVLQGIYGDSYGFMAGEDCWEPDGQGGWVAHGHPDSPPPEGPSVLVPLWLYYIPIFLPTALLVLFLFTPLSRKLDRKAEPAAEQEATGGEGPESES